MKYFTFSSYFGNFNVFVYNLPLLSASACSRSRSKQKLIQLIHMYDLYSTIKNFAKGLKIQKSKPIKHLIFQVLGYFSIPFNSVRSRVSLLELSKKQIYVKTKKEVIFWGVIMINIFNDYVQKNWGRLSHSCIAKCQSWCQCQQKIVINFLLLQKSYVIGLSMISKGQKIPFAPEVLIKSLR